MKTRADTARRWIRNAEGAPDGGDGWLPWSVRTHFDHDWPALVAEVGRLQRLLGRLVDRDDGTDPCRPYPDGDKVGCFSHGVEFDDDNDLCPVAEARALLDGG